MFARAVFAFLALPGTVAYVVPLLLAPTSIADAPWRLPGIVLISTGTLLLLWCVRDFYVIGTGTLAPWSPPRRLVAVGLYRWTRNPMYVAVLVVLLGWCVAYRSVPLAIYLCVVAVAFHLRILFYEEPRLKESFGEEWIAYRQRVPRWVPRLR